MNPISWLLDKAHRRWFASMPFSDQQMYFRRYATEYATQGYLGRYVPDSEWERRFFPILPREAEEEYRARIRAEVDAMFRSWLQRA